MLFYLIIISFISYIYSQNGCASDPKCGYFIAGGPLYAGKVFPNNQATSSARIGRGCYCDTYCMQYGDCCANYVTLCQSIDISIFILFYL